MATASNVFAADPGATIITKLYIDVCVPNMGKPDQVRAWAADKHLPPITAETALAVFVGPGAQGGAWFVPSDAGSFVVSIRGTTAACAVWARTADPNEVESTFTKLIQSVARPGIDTTKMEDKTVDSSFGRARSLIYSIKMPDSPQSFIFTMLTVERPGGAFQASLQLAKAHE
jgi:hypothetical protein